MERQQPIFVLKILAQKSGNDLFYFLKSKTPYCDLFNFLEFIEQITNKIGDESAKKIVSRSKELLYHTKKDDILPYMEIGSSEKEDFSKVVSQMQQNFKITTVGGIQCHRELTSDILRLKNLVCFDGYDEEHHTVTYLIPSMLTEAAYSSADKCANIFFVNDILSITIGGNRIFSRIGSPVPELHHSLNVNSSSKNIN